MNTKLKEIIKEIKIRQQVENISSEILELENKLKIMKNELENLKEKAPSDSEIKDDLKSKLESILKRVGLNNIRDVSINKRTYLPVFRNKEYMNITSGGVRTVLSFAYYLSILERSLTNELYKPNLLMIDTIGKYIGTNTNPKYLKDTDNYEDESEKLSNDPEKYHKMYQELDRVCKEAENLGKKIQILVVDNDYPGPEYEKRIIKKFSVDVKEGYEIGFIDDIK